MGTQGGRNDVLTQILACVLGKNQPLNLAKKYLFGIFLLGDGIPAIS